MLVQPAMAAQVADPSPVRSDPALGPGTRAVIAGLLVLTAMRVDLYAGVGLGTIVGIALAPAWLPRVRGFSGAAVFGAIVTACLASGVWLTALASTDHVTIERQVWSWAALMVGLVTTVGAVLWARTAFGDATVAVLFGIGMVAGISPSALGAENPWKSALSVPLTVLLLGFAWMVRKRWLEVVLALLLAAVSAANDSRSHFAVLLMATAFVVWQIWFRGGHRTGSVWRAVVIIAGLAWAIYSMGQALVLDGYLGQETQTRSAAQVESAGSIILGGRPEIGATAALMAERPWGLGIGTSPTVQEILVAKAGMTQLGYDPNNGYVEHYMFGELVELHSIIGDTWALFGIPGLVLSGFLAWAMVHRASTGFAARNLSALMAVLVVRICWDLFFGPLYSALPILALAVGLALRRRGTAGQRREDPAPLAAVRSAAAPSGAAGDGHG
jgi:hypothetical protein